MNEYEALRREIEVRLQRETAYQIVKFTYAEGSEQVVSLNKLIDKNDKVIALIGSFLLEKGSEWEKKYKESGL